MKAGPRKGTEAPVALASQTTREAQGAQTGRPIKASLAREIARIAKLDQQLAGLGINESDVSSP